MQNLVKRPLKLIAAAAFMVALGYGVSTTNPDILEVTVMLICGL